MRIATGLWGIVVCVACQGCDVFKNSLCNLAFETAQYHDGLQENARYKQWAMLEWIDYQDSRPEEAFSLDYAQGFEDGFVDYVRSGGSGEPPRFPPRKYRRAAYQTPEGFLAIQDWFAGFRQGAAVAREGEYRQLVIIPHSTAKPGPGLLGRPPLDVPPGPPTQQRDTPDGLLPFPRVEPKEPESAK